mgnify:CR=1 FL=1
MIFVLYFSTLNPHLKVWDNYPLLPIIIFYLPTSMQVKVVLFNNIFFGELIIDDNLELGMGGQLKDVTVLFADIRGFTSMSEKIEPNEVVNLLNKYFTEMIDIIFKYNGTLDKIVGDELMVVFGAPIEIENAPDLAIQTAMEMQKQLIKFNKTSNQPIEIGIGINSGNVISGNIGSEIRSDYTVIGDNVNLAARLCSFARARKIIISENTFNKLKNNFQLEKLAPFSVKGKEKLINGWEVLY